MFLPYKRQMPNNFVGTINFAMLVFPTTCFLLNVYWICKDNDQTSRMLLHNLNKSFQHSLFTGQISHGSLMNNYLFEYTISLTQWREFFIGRFQLVHCLAMGDVVQVGSYSMFSREMRQKI